MRSYVVFLFHVYYAALVTVIIPLNVGQGECCILQLKPVHLDAYDSPK